MKARLLLPITFLFLCATAQTAAAQKVKVCHIPPGDPGNFHSITVAAAALPAHLAHGDLPGACAQFCDRLCDDGNPCTIDACDAAEKCMATHPPVNCNDGNLCTTDSCDPAAGCVSTPIVCMDNDNCTVNACDPLTGTCVAPPVECPVGQICEPGSGQCVGSDPCQPNPCLNSGTCSRSSGGYTCACLPGWTGVNCQTRTYNCSDRNPCPDPSAPQPYPPYFSADNPTEFIQCSEHGECFVMPCPPGQVWSQSQVNCVDP